MYPWPTHSSLQLRHVNNGGTALSATNSNTVFLKKKKKKNSSSSDSFFCLIGVSPMFPRNDVSTYRCGTERCVCVPIWHRSMCLRTDVRSDDELRTDLPTERCVYVLMCLGNDVSPYRCVHRTRFLCTDVHRERCVYVPICARNDVSTYCTHGTMCLCTDVATERCVYVPM